MLSELEMYEVIKIAYPDIFSDEDEEDFDEVIRFAGEIHGYEDIADLLERVVYMTMPLESPLTKTPHHCLGQIRYDTDIQMTAVLCRKADRS